MLRKITCLVLVSGFLMSCESETAILPTPEPLTDMASGTYCGMTLTEHAGPKAQVFEKGRKEAIWFTAVRDALAYRLLPGEAQSIVTIYVHDMGEAVSWEKPQRDGIWIPADTAFYVVGSDRRGGMGMPEVVPFSSALKAADFARLRGGEVVAFNDVPTRFLFPELKDDNETVVSAKEKEEIQ